MMVDADLELVRDRGAERDGRRRRARAAVVHGARPISADPLGLLVAFGAGMLSFLSPCVLPARPRLRVDGVGALGGRARSGAAPATLVPLLRGDPRLRRRLHRRLHRPRGGGLGARASPARPPTGLRHRRPASSSSSSGVWLAGVGTPAPVPARAPLPSPAVAARGLGPARHGHGLRLRLDPVHRPGPRAASSGWRPPGPPWPRGWSLLVAYSLGLGRPVPRHRSRLRPPDRRCWPGSGGACGVVEHRGRGRSWSSSGSCSSPTSCTGCRRPCRRACGPSGLGRLTVS